MKRGIHIYINGEELELGGNANVLYNYQTKDLQNPSIVRNLFSKKISVPGTANNNRIFSGIWNLDSTGFNAGQKADFALYVDDELYETGYAKLDGVSRRWNETTYEISLFGGLGDYFYSLAQRQEDSNGISSKKSLADLVYRYEGEDSEEVDLDFNITMRTVKDAWDNVAGWSTKWRFLNFAPAYNGTPGENGFDGDKALNFGYRETVYDDGKTYTPYENWWVVDQLQRAHTGAEMREFRSYLQRPVIRTMEVIKACCLPENNGGYQVNLDPDFFNPNNPYWFDAYSTLPMLSSLQYTAQEEAGSGFTVTLGNTYDTGGSKGTRWSGYTETRGLTMTNPQGKAFSVKGNFALEAVFADTPSPSEYTEIRTTSYEPSKRNAATTTLYGVVLMQLVAYDPFGQAVAGSKIAMLSSPWSSADTYPNGSYLTEHGWVSPYGNEFELYKGAFKYDSGRWVWENAVTLYIEQVPSNCTVRLIVDREIQYIHRGTSTLSAKTLLGYDPDYARKFKKEDYTHFNVALVDYEATVSTGEGVRSGAKITKEMLLSTDFTPADYLISYCKLFGLYFRKDPARKVIDILTRGNFYSGGIEDISDRIDRDDVTITPLTFTKKWYNFGLEESESEYGDDYKKVYGVEYGDALINTGYEFNADTEEVFSGNIFKSAVQVVERSDAFAVIESDPGELVYTRRGFGYALYNNNVLNEAYDVEVPSGSTFDVTTGLDGENRYYDLFSKVQLHTSDNSPADGSNVLLFYVGLQDLDTPTKELRYRITDDNEIMFKLNDGSPCWLASQSEFDQYGHEEENRIMINADTCPAFSRYIIYGPSGYITKSWDFGEPKTLYIPNAVSREDGTLYSQCWKNYISDLYNPDTRIVTTKVKWDGRVTIDTLRKFYWFDNCYWVINRIADWDVLGRGLTETEFVKVNDPANYGSEPITKDPTLTVTLSSYSVPITGGTVTFDVVTSDNGPWYAEYDPDVVTVVPAQDSASTTGGTITIQPNEGSGDRDVEIYFFADPASVKVVVSQRAYSGQIQYLGTSYPGGSSSDVVPDTGGTIYLNVIANGAWTLNGQGTMSQSAGTATEGTVVSVVIPENSYSTQNQFYYTLTMENGTWVRSQYINQAGAGNPYITPVPSMMTLNASGGTAQVQISANVDWSGLTTYPAWLTIAPTSGTSGTTQAVVTAQPNTGSTSRYGQIMLQHLGYNEFLNNITVFQEGASEPEPGSGITISPMSRTSPESGDSFTISVVSSGPWELTSNDAFITASPVSGGSGTTSVSVTVDANSSSARTGSITFALQSDPSTVLATFGLEQQAHVDTQGYFKYKSSTGDSLVPRGATPYMNENGNAITETDDVTVSSGDWSPYREKTFSGDLCELGNSAFSGRTAGFYALRWTVSGGKPMKIGNQAFRECTALQSVEIYGTGSGWIGNYAFYGCTALTAVTINFPDEYTAGGSVNPPFYGCTNLVTADISVNKNNINNIGDWFSGCTSLKTVTLRSTGTGTTLNITASSSDLFKGNANLETVTLSGYTSINASYKVFVNCQSLTDVYWNGTVAEAGVVGSKWSSGCPSFVVHCSDGNYTVPSTL